MIRTSKQVINEMRKLVEDSMPTTNSVQLFVVGFVEDGETLYRTTGFDDTPDITQAIFFKSREEAQAEIDNEIDTFSGSDSETDGSEYFIKEVTLSY